MRPVPAGTTDLATAYHEAGHAVMAHLCGQTVTGVEIIGDEERSGSCSSLRLHDEPEMGDDPAVRTAPLEARVLCLCAGLVSESMATGRQCWDESSDELVVAVRLAMRVLGDCEKVIAYLEQAREHTEGLLRTHWPAVEELAAVLVERRSMTGPEVRAVLEPLLPT